MSEGRVLSPTGRILLETLQALSELELQSRVVEPLLQASGFVDVRDVSGPNEKGRDLVASKRELGTVHYYGIQVKKLKLTGRVDDPAALMGLLYQLDQAIHEESLDPNTLSRRIPDRLIFVTPYQIHRGALDAAFEKYRTLSRNQVTVMDGPTLVSEIMLVIPHIAGQLSAAISRRVRMVTKHEVIAESKAFGLSKPLNWQDIFVEADYACFDVLDDLLSSLLETDPRPKDGEKPTFRPDCSPAELEILQEAQLSWQTSGRSAESAIVPTAERGVRRWFDPKWAWQVDRGRSLADYSIGHFVGALVDHASELTAAVSALDDNASEQTLNTIHTKIAALQAIGADLRKTGILHKRSHLLTDAETAEVIGLVRSIQTRRRLLNYRHLYLSSSTFVITGVAGAGKTTLLKTLLLKASEADLNRDVVFHRAVDLSIPSSVDDLVEQLRERHNDDGDELSAKAFDDRLVEGTVRIMIDGLDETGDRSHTLAARVLDLTLRYPKCPVAVTSREIVDLGDWRTALHLRVCPFNDEQLATFVTRWFSAKPSSRDGLLYWLDRHPMMKDVARTPLVAALLCSLYDVGEAVLPVSEMQLYNRRLDFLLGRWEEAKAIAVMHERMRERYALFLMHLAHEAHTLQSRSVDYSRAIVLASRFISAGFDRNAGYIIKDCEGRGLLEREGGQVSLGHLVHQEFLVGKFLHKYNDVSVLASRLGLEWWRRPLHFYAALVGDISAFLRTLTLDQRRDHQWQIRELIEAAPETPHGQAMG